MADDWPKRPNGTRKRISEMTPEKRMRVWKLAAENLKTEFDNPESQISKVLRDRVH